MYTFNKFGLLLLLSKLQIQKDPLQKYLSFMKTPLLSFTQIPHAVQAELWPWQPVQPNLAPWARKPAATRPILSSIFFVFIITPINTKDKWQNQGRSLPWCTNLGARVQLQTWHKSGNSLKKLISCKESEPLLQRDQTVKSLLARALDIECGIIAPANHDSARILLL